MLRLFADNLLPVFLAAGAGYLLAATLRLEARPIAQVAYFVFAPCLVFRLLIDSEIRGGELLRMSAYCLCVLLALGAIAVIVGGGLGWSRTTISALVLVTMLPNAGNFGLSATQFAFGPSALARASVFFVVSSMLTFTVGVLVASLGRQTIAAALFGLLRVPALWAVPLGLLVAGTETAIPAPIARTVDLLSNATIPVFLVVLGIQLHGKGLRGPIAPIAFAVALRLVGGALAGLLGAELFGLQGVARQAGVLQAAMPSAVISIVLATEYEVEPALVTSVVMLTTLLSPASLTPLLSYLGA